MKRKGLFSGLVALFLLCSVVAGILVTGVQAQEATVIYTVGDMDVSGAVVVDEFSEALAAIDAKNGLWKKGDSVEIRFSGTALAGAENNLLFGQTTVWREDNTKLPITIRGVDTTNPRDASIFLDPIGGWYACANDYTFVNLTLPVADQETKFYAGSGEIYLKNVSFSGKNTAVIKDRADQMGMHSFTVRMSEAIAADEKGEIKPDVRIVPAGDAWELVRQRDEQIGQGLNGTSGKYYGDYVHDGDVGGGQYINGCVYFEVLTGISCVGNTWVPDYDLDQATIAILQEEAHKAVLARYGEEHFENPRTDIIGNDGVINLLILGSSNNAYLYEEVYNIAKAAGVNIRVCHAYSSGILISAQWSWVEKDNGSYSFRNYYNNSQKTTEKQKITDFLGDYTWDAIVTYQSSNGIEDYGFDEAAWQKTWDKVEKADDFYNWIWDWNNGALQDAEYYWYEVTAYPIGAPGPSSDALGYIYADNCTEAVYAGWTEEQIAKAKEMGDGKIVSSVTLGEGCEYNRIGAKGYISERRTGSHMTDEEAKAVKFLSSVGYENIPDIRPIDTHAKFIIDGGVASRFFGVKGYSPADITVHLKSGGVTNIGVFDNYPAPASGEEPYIYGDATVKISGGGIAKTTECLANYHLKGNITVDISSDDGKVSFGDFVRMGWSSHSVDGDITLSVRNVDIPSSLLSGGNATGVVSTYVENANITGSFHGVRVGNAGRVVNTMKNVVFGGDYYGGHFFDNSIGPVENHLTDVNVGGVWCGGNMNSSKTNVLGIVSGTVKVDGQDMTLAVYNKVDGLEVGSDCYAGSRYGMVNGGIYNDFTDLKVNGKYIGGVNRYKKADEYLYKVDGPIVNKINGATISGDYYGGTAGDFITGPVENYITNVSVTGWWVGGNYNYDQTSKSGVSAGTIKVDGQDMTLAVYNKVNGLTLENYFCGGSKCGTNATNGSVYNDVTNLTAPNYIGGTTWGTIKGDITNIVKNSTITNYYGGANSPAANFTVQGNITNTLTGGTYDFVNGVVSGSKKVSTVNNDVTNVIEGDIVIQKGFSGISNLTDVSIVDITVKGNVTNTIRKADGKEPTLGTKDGSDFAFYGAGHHAVASKGVVNYIQAGTFNNTVAGLAFRVGEGKTIGKVTLPGYEDYSVVTFVSGGTFNSVFHGGLIGSGGTLSGGICNEITGGVFKNLYDGGSRGIALGVNNPVKNVIRAGTFNSTVYLASMVHSPKLQSQGLVAKVDSEIYDGVFAKSLYAACRDGGNVTDCTLTIYGGVFNSVYAGSEALTDENGTVTGQFQTTDVTLTIKPTSADVVLNKVVSSRGENETIRLEGGSKKIILAYEGGLLATEYDGAAQTVQQNNRWDADFTYLQVPADKADGITTMKKDSTVTGYACKFVVGENAIWKGITGAQVIAANLILEDKVGVRLWINKAMADAVGEELTFTVTRSDVNAPVYTGTYAQLIAGEVKDFDGVPCYTVVLPGTAPSAFHVDFEVSGTGVLDFNGSINDILSVAIGNETGEFAVDFVNTCKALWNYGIEAYDRFSGQTSSLNRETVEENSAEILNVVNNNGDGSVVVAGKSLVLREAVGIKIFGLVNVSPENLRIVANGVELSADQFEFKVESGSAAYNMSITVFVKLPAMADQFTISIYNGESFACSVTESIASCSQQYVNAGGKDAALCASLLSLIKAISQVNA